jgi:arylsulfatase A-like enzyme
MPEDLYPTILDMAGVKWQGRQVQEVDGQSLVALMTKGSKMAEKAAKRGEITNQKEATHFVVPQSVSGIDPERYVLFHYPHKWKAYDLADIDYLSSIRKGEWKLVYRMATGELELYNLNDDIGEQHNLASQHPERVRALASALGERLRRWNAPMPVVNATGQAVAMPDEL